MTTRAAQVSALSLLGYSVVMPAVWLGFGTIINAVAPGKRAGIVGLAFVVLIVVTFTSWLFVRRYRRSYSTREFWFLVGYCAVWAILCEFGGLIYAISEGIISSPDVRALVFAVCLSAIVDTLFVFLGFKFTGTRFINWYLASFPAESPNNRSRGP